MTDESTKHYLIRQLGASLRFEISDDDPYQAACRFLRRALDEGNAVAHTLRVQEIDATTRKPIGQPSHFSVPKLIQEMGGEIAVRASDLPVRFPVYQAEPDARRAGARALEKLKLKENLIPDGGEE